MDDLQIDFQAGEVRIKEGGVTRVVAMDTPEAFEAISAAWLRAGWDVKHVYSFTWLGRPMIQLPEDMLRLQELIFTLKPDVIVETGVAHGGSLIFYASLCKAMGKGRVIGVDIDIRPHNRKAIEEHFLAPYITLIQGSSIEPSIVNQVRRHIAPADRVLVTLDSAHHRTHVLAELEAYGPMVTEGSFIVAMDGIMEQVVGGRGSKPEWIQDNPKVAAAEFAATHPEFKLTEPAFLFNEGSVRSRVTYWPGAFLQRVR